jgi:DNA polymerase-3 subunit alpha
VDDFINRKHGRSKVEYPHPALEAILKPTYGVILYQEQVMQIAQVLAGYTLGGADMLRRAMGKKKPEEMEQQREIFTEGAVANNVDRDNATYIFDLMEKFAGYGFNKSHSAAYALVSYQTAWLKTHYPAEFMASVLSADLDNTDKIVTLIDECREMKLTVLPPDINQSNYRFSTSADGLVFYGLGAIKGVGQGAIEAIILSRKESEYQSLDDFCERVDTSRSNRKVIEALIKAGAMDCFSSNRAALMAHLSYALQSAEQRQNNIDAGMTDMFAEISPAEVAKPLPDCEAWDEKARLIHEKEALGLFLTGHPLSMVEKEVKQITSTNFAHWLDKLNTGIAPANNYRQKDQQTTVCGLVVDIRSKNGFNGREVFVTLDDRSGRIEVRVVAKLFQEIEEIVKKDVIWVVDGGIAYDDFNNGIKIRASRVQLLENYRFEHARALHIHLHGHAATWVEKLITDLDLHRSANATPVIFHLQRDDYLYELKTNGQWSVTPSEACLLSLERLLDKGEYYLEYR